MKQEHIVNREGADFVKYEGLLDEAHRQGLKRIATTLIQVPHEDNGNMAIVQAEAETEKGTFSGIGDASPQNVGRATAMHLVKIAEIRAKARALGDAVNIGPAAVVEPGRPDDPSNGQPAVRPASAPEAAMRETAGPYRADFPKASPAKPATANQLATIAKLSRLLGKSEEPDEDMSSAEASERITELSREYNERKGSAARRSA